MVLGYDEKRPSKKDYNIFLDKFSCGLSGLKEKEISFMVYGSYVRGDYIPGRSDIDALLILPGDVVIDKDVLRNVSKAFADIKKDNTVPFQVTVSDSRTMQEGTFNSYDPNFKSYFDEEGKIIVGEDYRGSFNYQIAKLSDQNSLRFNLRKSRLALFFAEYYLRKDYSRFLERFNKTLDATSRASKQILTLVDGSLRKNRFSALEELSEVFPEIDLEPLIRIKYFYHNLKKLDSLYRDSEGVLKIWNNSVSFFETIIKNYLDMKK